MLQLTFLSEHKAQFFHLGLNQNDSTYTKVLFSKLGGFVSRRNPHNPKIQENTNIFDIAHYSN